ncbi:MAG TPA: hypothetical protein VEI97_04030, partial [bacterium]|nr:hypothetical protein [bacterium]
MAVGQVGLFLYNQKVVVIPVGASDGRRYDVEPYSLVPAVPESVDTAIRTGFEVSIKAQMDQAPSPAKSPLVQALGDRAWGVKSQKDFFRTAGHCALYARSDFLYIGIYGRHKKGGFTAKDRVPLTSDEGLGSLVLAVMQADGSKLFSFLISTRGYPIPPMAAS